MHIISKCNEKSGATFGEGKVGKKAAVWLQSCDGLLQTGSALAMFHWGIIMTR